MNMIQSRNLSSHTYDEATAAQIASAIRTSYFSAFEELWSKLENYKNGSDIDLTLQGSRDSQGVGFVKNTDC